MINEVRYRVVAYGECKSSNFSCAYNFYSGIPRHPYSKGEPIVITYRVTVNGKKVDIFCAEHWSQIAGERAIPNAFNIKIDDEE